MSAIGQTKISFYYLDGGLGVKPEIISAMENKVITEMAKLFSVNKEVTSAVCIPSTSNPKKICVEYSERMAGSAGALMGYTIISPPSLLAGLVKSKVVKWINDQLNSGNNFTLQAIGEGIAVLAIHEIGHSCGVLGDYKQTTANQQQYMALPTSTTYAKNWFSSEITQIQQYCQSPTGPPPPSAGAADGIPNLPVPPQTIPFYYLPNQTVTNLSTFWGFKDVLNFEAIQGSDGSAPTGKYSTSMTKTSGTNYGWGTTPIFTQVDRTLDAFTLSYDANWSISNTNPLSSTNFLCASLSKWNGSSLSYDYNFYYRPKNWLDAYETNDHLIYKSGFSTLVGQVASHDYATWTGSWNSFKITVDKVQSAGGTGQINYFGYNVQAGWRLLLTVVDNTYTTFNTVDFWHSTDPSSETTVKIDNIVVKKGIN